MHTLLRNVFEKDKTITRGCGTLCLGIWNTWISWRSTNSCSLMSCNSSRNLEHWDPSWLHHSISCALWYCSMHSEKSSTNQVAATFRVHSRHFACPRQTLYKPARMHHSQLFLCSSQGHNLPHLSRYQCCSTEGRHVLMQGQQ